MRSLRPSFGATRASFHLLAVYVLSAVRQQHTGRVGLRPTIGGFGTPAFIRDGAAVQVRIDGGVLVVDTGGDPEHLDLQQGDVSLDQAAAFVGVTLDPTVADRFDVPPLADPRAPLPVLEADAAALSAWYGLGASVLDALRLDAQVDRQVPTPSQVQLWPEHFDLAFDLGDEAAGTRANVGFSPGDAFSDEPYLYVGPWARDRIDPTTHPDLAPIWNAPFGAVLLRSQLTDDASPADEGREAEAWIREALGLLTAPGSSS